MTHLIRSLAGLTAVSLSLALAGCGGGGGSGGGTNDSDKDPKVTVEAKTGFEVSTFTAQYYFEDDGTTPGSGNDGSDPDIIPVLVAQETTDRIAINYIYDDLDGIDSYNFYGVWEGTLTAYEPSTIDISFDYSWSNVDFYLDGVLTQEWINSNKTLRVTVDAGSHAIRAELHNHWNTTGFNITFTQYDTFATSAAAAAELTPLVTEDTRIVYVGAYESDSFYNEVTIELPEYAGDIILFVSSNHSLNIIIENPYDTAIAAVVVNSYNPLASVEGQGDAPVYHVKDFDYGYSDFTAPRADINVMTGQDPDYETGAYAIESVVIPAL